MARRALLVFWLGWCLLLSYLLLLLADDLQDLLQAPALACSLPATDIASATSSSQPHLGLLLLLLHLLVLLQSEIASVEVEAVQKLPIL